jgi:hypothetical protein
MLDLHHQTEYAGRLRPGAEGDHDVPNSADRVTVRVEHPDAGEASDVDPRHRHDP